MREEKHGTKSGGGASAGVFFGARRLLGADHGVTMAFAKAAESMAPADLWLARIAVKTLRRDQREAIAAATENEDQSSLPASRPPGARLCARLVVRG